MKRYEQMNKTEILHFFLIPCVECKLRARCKGTTCARSKIDYLTEEIKIKKVHRYELIKSPEDTEKLRCEWKEYCNHKTDCSRCKYDSEVRGSSSCFANYLNEEIEVEE